VSKQVRHILSLSGGKDSSALAVYMRDRIPQMEYVFCDTEKELPETYDYLARLEAYLGKPITVLKHDGRDFDHWLHVYGGYLPSPQMRWCTRHLKLEPFEKFVRDDPVMNHVGIRADEHREGLISTLPNIKTVFPFKEDGIVKEDVLRILAEAGLGLPDYYRWRSRSGCYFCFFQQKIEWVGLMETHPKWFKLACQYEEETAHNGKCFYWSDERLRDLARPERVAEIKADFAKRIELEKARQPKRRLMDIIGSFHIEDADNDACLICRL